MEKKKKRRILETSYAKKTTSDRSAQEILWEGLQKTKREIEAGRANVFGESYKEDTMATDEFLEATANKGHSLKEVNKYKLTMKKTEGGVKVPEGTGNGTSWSGRYLHKCQCAHHKRLWKVWNMKEF